MSTIGFLGLGSMGSAMAGRLIDAGHEVRVWNRSPDAVAAAVSRGAVRVDAPEEALACAISFSMLANDEAMQAVMTQNRIAVLRGRIHVAMASISPDLAASLADQVTAAGGTYIAAPVLGRPSVAAEGELNILVAGSPSAVGEIRPYLDAMGKRVWILGERPSVANAVKAAVNYNIIHAMQAIGESVAMTERLGVPAETFTELLSSTLFGGVAYSGYGDIIAAQRYSPPGFHIALGRKDLDLAEQVARSVGVSPATLPALTAVFEAALAHDDLKDLDWSAIAEVSRRDVPILGETAAE
ncbi:MULTISPECIES: NAD(P)-dependent oxidoreductase [unclassified Microbacterium]|uniref:NAD(P)-dependent oxidoreductase n=1 Tax=unclassified Microbacterium TaxID=2609290 RepID=UPI0026228DEA|nr:NAD(P)-dependent oxidoreductase [Microbacterium sp.]